MNDLVTVWIEWLRPSIGLTTVQWSLLLAAASAIGYLLHRFTGLPKVMGYALAGSVAGFAGFGSAAPWPLRGNGLFLLELGIAVVLFEAGGRVPLRWFRHNPMVLVQSVAESALTYAAVALALHWMGLRPAVYGPLAMVAVAASPAVLARVAADAGASGPVTDRAMVLATLSTLYALAIGTAQAELLAREELRLLATIGPAALVLGLSVAVGAALALALRLALRVMSPASENTSILLLALIAAAAGIASHLGGSAPLAALLGGMLLKQFAPRPWSWPRQLGSAASLLTMLMFVLVSVVTARADWHLSALLLVAVLVGARAVAKIGGVVLGKVGSGINWRQAWWVGCALTPMSSIALLVASQYAQVPGAASRQMSGIALPAILVLELLGGVLATVALHRAREASHPWLPRRAGRPPQAAPAPLPADAGDDHGA
ncbi:sodium:proton exchanger [Xylophilus rhododendri]|uniref:Sodium:proton exchanger n=1 Tax=Xylophilus rhododendri TaxID=2697032 RepID=A0A857J6D4_9BURK|nr:cation:proton antiporter [Xylophilus rhododendri]QHI98649.1 sodium:proton exchanger [Xylophilus rhododendri]